MRGLKRPVEVTVAGVALVLLSPALLLIGVLIKLSSPGPVLHKATRMGRGGRTFLVLKFRTMVEDASKKGPGVTGAADPRVTTLGSRLRRVKLDELPQLVNVLRGDMSLVGPRPEDPRYLRYYTRKQLALLDVAPGITSHASLHFIDEKALLTGEDWERIYVEEVLPAKLDLELGSFEKPSLRSDVSLLFQTLTKILRPTINLIGPLSPQAWLTRRKGA